MNNLKQEIISSLQKVIKQLTGQEIVPQLEHPMDEKHGDYASNIAMVLFKDKGLMMNDKKDLTPLKLAEEIVEKLNNSSLIPNHCSRIKAAAPGFINFWISKEYLISQLSLISNKTSLRQGFAGRRIMVEFTDPNPFKEFHIGHLYSNIVGESISRLLEAQGAIVKRVNYQGDVGMHVAKALWGIFHLCHAEFSSASQILENKILKQVQDDNVNRRIKFLGEAYAVGAKAYEEDKNAKKEIEELNKKIYDKEPAIMDLYEKGRRWSLEYFETIYKRLGTKFDFYYFESAVGKIGIDLVKEFLKKGVFEESKGAVIFPGEKYGLHNRVFINSLGLPTYEAKDLGLAPTKYKDFPYDLSIIITAQEQSDYFKVVIKALSLINPKLGQKTKHIAHGVVRLPSGKMSSRTGTVITGEWLLDEAKRKISQNYKEMDEETAEKVAVGAVKYALLKSGIGRDIAFNFDESISLEGNSGPYLQYTFARTQSVLAKASIGVMPNSFRHLEPAKKEILKLVQDHRKNMEPEEALLLRALYKFPEIVGETAEKFSPNILCNYLFDLSQKFNLFYQKHKILSPSLDVNVKHPEGVIETQEFRLTLTMSVGQVIKNGLYLLGIQAPEKM